MATAFISYAHEDQELILALADHLAEEELDVEFDQIVLRIGDSLIARIADAITEDDFLIAVVSPDSVESEWCRKELALAMTQGINQRRPKVLPVRVRGAEMPPPLGDTFFADADKFDIPSVAHALAVAIKSHREGGDVDAAVAEADQASSFQPSPQQERRRGELVGQLDNSVVERVFAVLQQWEHAKAGGPVDGLRDAQRRLRFGLDAIADELRDALPLVGSLAEAVYPEDFEVLSPDQIEGDLREEIRTARSQLLQGLRLSRRWMLAGVHRQHPAERRFATVHRWEIEREGDDRRFISVYISHEVTEMSGLPREVEQAKTTNGRSAARAALSVDEPPREISVTTHGISWRLPD
jgi:hypothetical protein